MKSSRIGFLGAGNMAGALISGLLASGAVDESQICISDAHPERLAELAKTHGIQTRASNAELVAWANVVVLSVKPQVVPAVLSECGANMGAGHLVISIAAGVPIAALETMLGTGARVVRAMPNTPALVRAAAT